MNEHIIFDLFYESPLASNLASMAGIETAFFELSHFHDGETYIRIDSNMQDKTAIVVTRLDHPDDRILALLFMLDTIRELGANRIVLVAPYMPYLRQDTRFKPGEAFAAKLFAKLFDDKIDALLTVDPHLHRIHKLSELYKTDCYSLHAVRLISNWISENLKSTLIIGLDDDSKHWIELVAKNTESPHITLHKQFNIDETITVTVPDIEDSGLLPVFIDDIISRGTTLVAGMNEMIKRGFKDPVCIGVHGVFDTVVYNNLTKAGAQQIITTNTVPNFTSKIDICGLLYDGLRQMDIIQND